MAPRLGETESQPGIALATLLIDPTGASSLAEFADARPHYRQI